MSTTPISPSAGMAQRLGGAEEGEPALLLLGQDLDRDPGRRADRLGDLLAVARLAHRGGGDGADLFGPELLRQPHLGGDDLAHFLDFLRRRSAPSRQRPCRSAYKPAAPSPSSTAHPQAPRPAVASCSNQYLSPHKESWASPACSQAIGFNPAEPRQSAAEFARSARASSAGHSEAAQPIDVQPSAAQTDATRPRTRGTSPVTTKATCSPMSTALSPIRSIARAASSIVIAHSRRSASSPISSARRKHSRLSSSTTSSLADQVLRHLDVALLEGPLRLHDQRPRVARPSSGSARTIRGSAGGVVAGQRDHLADVDALVPHPLDALQHVQQRRDQPQVGRHRRLRRQQRDQRPGAPPGSGRRCGRRRRPPPAPARRPGARPLPSSAPARC